MKIAVESIKIPQLIPNGFRQSVRVLITRAVFLEDKQSSSTFFVLKLAAPSTSRIKLTFFELEFKTKKSLIVPVYFSGLMLFYASRDILGFKPAIFWSLVGKYWISASPTCRMNLCFTPCFSAHGCSEEEEKLLLWVNSWLWKNLEMLLYF